MSDSSHPKPNDDAETVTKTDWQTVNPKDGNNSTQDEIGTLSYGPQVSRTLASQGQCIPSAEELAPPSPVSSQMPLVPGYEISHVIGRGGMGVVYQAWQIDLGRTVALKMMLPGLHNAAKEVKRIRSEASAIAQVEHPNIVRIYAVGEHSGLPYLSLEYASGGSLSEYLKECRRLTPNEAAQVVKTLAEAVHCAHEKQIVHRDLKPGNVLLSLEAHHGEESGKQTRLPISS